MVSRARPEPSFGFGEHVSPPRAHLAAAWLELDEGVVIRVLVGELQAVGGKHSCGDVWRPRCGAAAMARSHAWQSKQPRGFGDTPLPAARCQRRPQARTARRHPAGRRASGSSSSSRPSSTSCRLAAASARSAPCPTARRRDTR
eukprot:7169051-Prymnesium_polylepis.1